jgi:hypothetical protein
MYSGTTFRTKSGRMMGVHQKIDRIARRQIEAILPEGAYFPNSHEILHFEGSNGPDGIKRKSPGRDEPWHYIDPTNPDDTAVVDMIKDHIFNLGEALKNGNTERAAFEAAWMSHAIVDGLTPAHHYPLSDKIEELWGKAHTERLSIKDKNIIRGKSRRDTISKNWQYWGSGGVFTAHLMFELGVASTIVSVKFEEMCVSNDDIAELKRDGFEKVFLKSVHKIHDLKMYDEFGQKGWNRELATRTRRVLIPEIVKIVMLGWYQAVLDAEKKK